MATEEYEGEYEEQEVADPEETEVDDYEESEETQEVAEPEPQSEEQNSIYANMRRKAEADAQRKMDRKIQALCKDVTHPITGKPITTFAEYEDAISAQNRLQAERELEANNVDISVLDNYINNSPVLAQAQAIIEQNQQERADAQLKSDLEELHQLNSDVSTINDIAADPRFDEILAKVRNGASLVEAYKIVNFDILMNKNSKGAKQAAINQARGKAHLEPTEALGESTEGGIDETMLANLRSNFPEKSEKEIRKLYKQTFK